MVHVTIRKSVRILRMENVGAQLLEEILREITALEREVSRPLLNQVKPSETLNGTTGRYLLTRD